jgi:hypothetical protein
MLNKKIGDAACGIYYIYFLKKDNTYYFDVGLFTRVTFPWRGIILSDEKMTKYNRESNDIVIRKGYTWKQSFSFEPLSVSSLNVE